MILAVFPIICRSDLSLADSWLCCVVLGIKPKIIHMSGECSCRASPPSTQNLTEPHEAGGRRELAVLLHQPLKSCCLLCVPLDLVTLLLLCLPTPRMLSSSTGALGEIGSLQQSPALSRLSPLPIPCTGGWSAFLVSTHPLLLHAHSLPSLLIFTAFISVEWLCVYGHTCVLMV